MTNRFDQAAAYAIDLHRSQVRKATSTPYVAHLFAVCSLVLEDGGTEDETIAALLHDGPEDQGGEPVLDEIRARFGRDVSLVVAGLSDAMPPRARRRRHGASEKRDTCATSQGPRHRCCACRSLTSCTTRAQSWPTCEPMATPSGTDSTRGGRSRPGITHRAAGNLRATAASFTEPA